MRLLSLMAPLCLVLLSACDSTTVVVRDDDIDEPHLLRFYLVDSFGARNEYSDNVELVLDPYEYAGQFEIYWDVDSDVDYSITLTVNDRPELSGGIHLSSEVCGRGHSCDRSGLQLCQYFTDFSIGCGIDLWEVEHRRTAVEYLFEEVPDRLWFNIEVCDLSDYYCEIDSIPVLAY